MIVYIIIIIIMNTLQVRAVANFNRIVQRIPEFRSSRGHLKILSSCDVVVGKVLGQKLITWIKPCCVSKGTFLMDIPTSRGKFSILTLALKIEPLSYFCH